MDDLIKERILLKLLSGMNKNYKALFSARISEIKHEINSNEKLKEEYPKKIASSHLELIQKIADIAISKIEEGDNNYSSRTK